MKIVFMGTPEFSVPTLIKIIDEGHDVVAVVTQPDKAKGRGKSISFTPVKEVAIKYNIPVYQPTKVREEGFIEELKSFSPDVIVVVAFGQILPKSILDIPGYGCINVHASLLPKYRGAAPIQWAVINGEEETGVTTMHMDVGLDTGDMILKSSIKLDKDETGGSLHQKLSLLGADLLIETLNQLQENKAPLIKQDDKLASHVTVLNKELGRIDWTKPAEQIERLIRGLNPWPSAYTVLDNKTLKIWKADVMEKELSGSIGEVVDITRDRILVKTGRGILSIAELQLEGKKRMETDAFLRGYKVEKGIIL